MFSRVNRDNQRRQNSFGYIHTCNPVSLNRAGIKPALKGIVKENEKDEGMVTSSIHTGNATRALAAPAPGGDRCSPGALVIDWLALATHRRALALRPAAAALAPVPAVERVFVDVACLLARTSVISIAFFVRLILAIWKGEDLSLQRMGNGRKSR